jgi:hypothetical protein
MYTTPSYKLRDTKELFSLTFDAAGRCMAYGTFIHSLYVANTGICRVQCVHGEAAELIIRRRMAVRTSLYLITLETPRSSFH